MFPWRTVVLSGFVVGVVLCSARPLLAVPVLQLYIEGATYEEDTETWVVYALTGDPIRLWTIGNVDGPGGMGTIYNVRLSVAYDEPVGVGFDVALTPSTTGGFGGFTDPSTPSTPTYIQTVSDGSSPVLGDGSPLPSHGQFGPGIVWQEFALGNFSLTDSPTADFISSFPTDLHSGGSQINVYTVSFAGSAIEPFTVHFDLYDTVYSGTKLKAKFAPFSHDAEGGFGGDDPVAPEPSSMALLLSGGLGLCGYGWRRRRQQPC